MEGCNPRLHGLLPQLTRRSLDDPRHLRGEQSGWGEGRRVRGHCVGIRRILTVTRRGDLRDTVVTREVVTYDGGYVRVVTLMVVTLT